MRRALSGQLLRWAWWPCLLLLASCQNAAPCPSWEAWAQFRTTFMSEDGRIVDRGSADSRTVSEGQAYAMLFALAANDRTSFDRVLQWTENNLAAGDLTARLPAWLWGRAEDGTWGVMDDNAASDADTWMAYALLEAGRLWGDARYTALGQLLAERILREEVIELDGLGTVLLPAPRGFQAGEEAWRLNPSYLPMPLLRRLAQTDPRWQPVVTSARAVLIGSAVGGFSPDWTLYSLEEGFGPDPENGTQGDYDAIRVYLWAGMTHPDDPARNDVLAALGGMEAAVRSHGLPPAQVESGEPVQGVGPPGFSAALIPYLIARDATELADQQAQRLVARPVPEAAYYQQALRLFGLGWQQGWLRFAPDGRLQPRWDREDCR
ncbi:MAG: cellulose synthase complex periplasmic endoglucanase BcsZ [Algiphilus sp.]